MGHLNKHSLELTNRQNGAGVAFDGFIVDCDIRTVEASHQLAHRKNAQCVIINFSFQLVCGDLMGTFKPAARGGYGFVGKITDQFTKWIAAYIFSAAKTKILPHFGCSSLQP